MQTVAQRPGFIATVYGFGLLQLLLSPNPKIFRGELLRGLRSGVVDLADHSIAVGMNIDAQLDALGFGRRLWFS